VVCVQVDEDLHVWLLEVNPGPDFKQTGRKLQGVVGRMLADSVTVALDRGLAPPPPTTPLPSPPPPSSSSSGGEGRLGGAHGDAPFALAQLKAENTGFKAVYAGDWGTGASGGSNMKLY
jgi:hypothetical protein